MRSILKVDLEGGEGFKFEAEDSAHENTISMIIRANPETFITIQVGENQVIFPKKRIVMITKDIVKTPVEPKKA